MIMEPRRLNRMMKLLGSSLLIVVVLAETVISRSPQEQFARRDNDDSDLLSSLQPSAMTKSQCEPIAAGGLCSQMAYKSTKMPNFFDDQNQMEALERAAQYQDLVSSKCSAYIHAYICELLMPVCMEDNRFEIYPCRSLCRQVEYECLNEISQQNERWRSQGFKNFLLGFDCQRLPYESNGGGNSNLSGPCHEISPESMAAAAASRPPVQASGRHLAPGSQSNAGGYRPYQPALDTNMPPFITDMSRIDPSLIRPVEPREPASGSSDYNERPLNNRPVDNGDQRAGNGDNSGNGKSLISQLQSWGQTILWALVRYSNLLTIASVLLLLVALNLKRFRRLKGPFGTSPGGSGGQSHSVRGHKVMGGGPFDPMATGGGYAAPVLRSTYANGSACVSPSASSRSLMLIAGNHKQPPTHQLIDQQQVDPSQKLLHALSQNQTLINVNGTLERQLKQQNNANNNRSIGNRYLFHMQSNLTHNNSSNSNNNGPGDKQQLFSNTLDSQSSSNQYDCIQVTSSDNQTTSGQYNRNNSNHNSHNQRSRFDSPSSQQQASFRQQQLYSNILLTSPSHQVLLLNQAEASSQNTGGGSQRSTQYTPQRQLGSARASGGQPTPPPQRHAPFFGLSPYASPGGGNFDPQRSFQRRARKSTNSSGRTRPSQLDVGGARTAGYTSAASSGSSSAGSSAGSSSGVGQPTRGSRLDQLM